MLTHANPGGSEARAGLGDARRRRSVSSTGRTCSHPRPRSRRGAAVKRDLGGWIIIRISPAANLRPPSPEKNASRAGEG